MKKIVSLILALGLCISSTCASANSAVLSQTAITASAEVSGDYEYRLLDDGTAALKLYNGSASEIKIPDWIEGKAVTAIDAGAFSKCVKQKSITVPASVKTIGKKAIGYVKEGKTYKKLEGVTILCYKGSAAEKYAQDNGFETDDIKCIHIVEDWTVIKKATCQQEGYETGKCKFCGQTITNVLKKTKHKYKKTTVAPDCKHKGYDLYTCSVCGDNYKDNYTDIDKNAHNYGDWVTVKPSTPIADGKMTKTCIICKKTLQKSIAKANQRIYGDNRFETAFKIADTLKANNSGKKFRNIIVASGLNYADALSAAYLAKVKNAPLLITSPEDAVTNKLVSYIDANSESDATVYIIGGNNAVSQATQTKLGKYKVIRVSGPDRYITNLLVLREAGVSSQDMLAASGSSYADALSASAVGKPIILVHGNSLEASQKSFIKTLKSKKITVIGGTSAVSTGIEKQLKELFSSVNRIGGENRFETSVNVAKKFFDKPATMVLAYGLNFPDGLCGGPLAMNYKSPMILTANNYSAPANGYARYIGADKVAILGGKGLISTETVSVIRSTPVTAVSDANSVTLKWSKIKGAVKYRIVNVSGGNKVVGQTSSTSFTYKAPSAASFTFRIVPVGADGKDIKTTKPMLAIIGTKPAAVSSLSARSAESLGAKLSWNAVRCSYYQIFKKSTGKYQLIATCTTNTFTDMNVSGGSEYRYIVRSVYTDKSGTVRYGGYSPTAKISFSVKAPVVYVSESGEHYIKLMWEKLSSVSYYKVSILKDGKWIEHTTTDNYLKIDKLDRSTKYQFRLYGVVNSSTVTNVVSFTDATNSTVKARYNFCIYSSPNTGSSVVYYGYAGAVLTQKGKYSDSWYRVYIPGTNNASTGFVQASSFGGYMSLNIEPIYQLGWAGGAPLPTGCETTALATQLANGLGLPCTKNLLADNYLTINPNYVGDPNYASWGNPYTESGYGVMAPALAETTNRFLTALGVRDQYQIDVHTDNNKNMSWHKLNTGAINTSDGLDINGIKRELEKGHSLVIWWITRGDDPTSITSFTINRGERYTHDGTGTYTLKWVAHQHGSVITGYDETTGQFKIADVGYGYTVYHPFEHFMKIYTLQNRQSLVIYKKL